MMTKIAIDLTLRGVDGGEARRVVNRALDAGVLQDCIRDMGGKARVVEALVRSGAETEEPKPPSGRGLERMAQANLLATWNAVCPSGTRVAMRHVVGGSEYETVTRSPAWASASGNVVVLVEGRAGGFSLEFMRALRADEHAEPLPPRESGRAG